MKKKTVKAVTGQLVFLQNTSFNLNVQKKKLRTNYYLQLSFFKKRYAKYLKLISEKFSSRIIYGKLYIYHIIYTVYYIIISSFKFIKIKKKKLLNSCF